MSSSRKQDHIAARRAQRSAAASPYARPPPKKSAPTASSSFSSLFSFITAPFRKKETTTRPELNDRDSEAEVSYDMLVDDDDEDNRFTEPEPEPTPAAALSLRGHQLQYNLASSSAAPRRTSGHALNIPPPPQTPQLDLGHMNVSPEKLDVVTTFLNEKRASGQPLSEIEAAGIVKLIQDSVNEGVKPLAASPSKTWAALGLSAPSTPARPSSNDSKSAHSLLALPEPGAPTLPAPSHDTFNSNTPVLYRGPGRSSRSHTPVRSSTSLVSQTLASPASSPVRYRSSTFGSPAKDLQTSSDLAVSTLSSDSKRRKITDYDATPLPSGSGASQNTLSGSTSTASTNGFGTSTIAPSTPIASSLGRSSRPTFGVGSLHASVPSRPSPLRQSMRPDSPTSSPPSAGPSPKHQQQQQQQQQSTPTKTSSIAADVMREVIAKNTKKPDPLPEVTNPYERSSPFRSVARPRRTPVKPTKPKTTEVPPPMPEKKEERKELTALELIEKSAPKHLKRSTPQTPVPPAAAAKASRPKSPSPPRIPGSGAPFERSSFAPSPSQSLAKARRKTSYFLADDDDDEVEEVVETPEPKPKRRKPSPVSEPEEVIALDDESIAAPAPSKSVFATPVPPEAKKKNALAGVKDPYRSKEPSPLRQSFQPLPDSPPEPPTRSPKTRAGQLAPAALPTFTFPLPVSSSDKDVEVRARAVRTPLGDLPVFDLSSAPPLAPAATFDWTSAGIKPPPAKAGWVCSTCALENPADAREQCKYCEAKRPANASSASTSGFNWGAAGFKPPTKAGWVCSTCMLENPADVTSECKYCETKR